MKLLALLISLFNQTAAAPQKPDLSTPESTVRGFVTSYTKMDILRSSEFVLGAKMTAELKAAFNEQNSVNKEQLKALASITVSDLKTEIKENEATVTLTISANGQDGVVEHVPLRRDGTSWKIVGFDPKSFMGRDAAVIADAQKCPIRMMATTFGLFPIFAGARDKARTISCASNLKQIATGGLMYLQDYDEKFALKALNFKKAFYPYLKNNSIFHCPSDKVGVDSYSFNVNLQGIARAKVKRPAETVMVYEGNNGLLNFRHDGSANVAFVDGHVKQLTREQAKKLVWKP